MSDVFERVGALVKDGQVVNAILWADCTYDQLKGQYDHLEETTDMPVQPGIGWTWNKKDGYRSPQPYPSWSWDKNTMTWQPPTPMPEPTDEENPEPYEWDEETLSWIVPQWWIDQQEEQDETEEVG